MWLPKLWLHAYGADLALRSAIDALLTHHLPRTRAGSKDGTGSASAGRRGRLEEDRVTGVEWGVGVGSMYEGLLSNGRRFARAGKAKP